MIFYRYSPTNESNEIERYNLINKEIFDFIKIMKEVYISKNEKCNRRTSKIATFLTFMSCKYKKIVKVYLINSKNYLLQY